MTTGNRACEHEHPAMLNMATPYDELHSSLAPPTCDTHTHTHIKQDDTTTYPPTLEVM